jgi:hypothetical protein
MSEGKHEQGPVCNRNGDVVGKELRTVEPDEPVDADVFVRLSQGTQAGVAGDVLSGQTVEAIEDGKTGTVQVPAHGADTHRGGEKVFQTPIIDLSFGVVVDREGLGGEGFPAEGTPETGNSAEAGRMVKANMGEPWTLWWMGVDCTIGIGTEWRGEHRVPRYVRYLTYRINNRDASNT